MASFTGTPGNDTFNGTPDDDLIDGAAGNDSLSGSAGNDTLSGGPGVDTLAGGAGDDVFLLGVGDGSAPDAIVGVDPREEIREFTGDGTDTIQISGITAADIRIWSAASNTVTIGIDDGTGAYRQTDIFTPTGTAFFWDQIERLVFDGGEVFTGDSGMIWSGLDLGQTTYGTNRDDHITGNGGDDTLEGGDGNDTLDGGTGADNLTGGAGDDLYLIRAGDGGVNDFSIDIIQEDFGGGQDTISFADLNDGALRMFFSTDDIGNPLIGFVSEDAPDRFQATYVDHEAGSYDIWDRIEEIRLADGTTMTEATGLRAYGTDSGEILHGTRAGDWLTGALGDDSVFGWGGDDTLVANLASDDTLSGGEGADQLHIARTLSEVTIEADAVSAVIRWAGGSASFEADLETIAFDDVTLGFAALQDHAALNLSGTAGNDRLQGGNAGDTLNGGDGTDTLIGGDGDDSLIGGDSENDLRDVIYGGSGNDEISGGHGNDELRGDDGNDTIEGGFGADTVIGGNGNDLLTGSAWSDVILGGDGDDFVNGGWGHDRVNGGAGADRFFHIGIRDHGSDWIQDYNAAEGDVLQFGIGTATASQFQINSTHTSSPDGERSGDDNVEEAFIIYRPTGQIMWALVDGAGQDSINLMIAGQVYDLMA